MIDIPINIRENLGPVPHTSRSATTSNIDEVCTSTGLNPDIQEDFVVSEEDISGDDVQPTKAYVIDTSTHSVDQTLFPSGSETISDTLNRRFKNELLSPDNSICERECFDVILEKNTQFGIGVTIVGGETAGKRDLGIFIKSISKNGSAFKDGRIKPGDRLIAINDKNVEGLPHHEAVCMIKESPNSVKLTIAQILPPGSIKRGDNYYDDPVFQAKLKASVMDKHKNSDEENSSFEQTADDNVSPDVITVRNSNDVHKNSENNANNKNVQNDKNDEKNVAVDTIEGQIVASMDQVQQMSATVDVHSTLSQVDSLNSEIPDLPDDQKYGILESEPERNGDSDTDSEFEDVISKVIDNTYQTTNKTNSQQLESESMELLEVFLEKQQGSFGLNVTGGINTSVKHGGIYVKSIVKDSVADNDGTIQKGDRILEVDNISMEGYTHKQAVEALCSAPPFCKLLIARLTKLQPVTDGQSSPPDDSEHGKTASLGVGNQDDDIYNIFVSEDNTYTVDLVKGSYGLGFSTVGGSLEDTAEIEDRVVRIKRVFPIGPASDSGVILTGDVLLAVNGQSVAGLSHNETMSILRSAGKHVQLLMCNPSSEQLPPLAPAEGAESLEITPTGSTSNVTDTESDTDSEVDVTPRRQILITPPTGFALSPFPRDEDGNVVPRVASPPPPLPISPPPTMLSVESGENTPRDVEVEVGVAELVDSCTSEMVLINNFKPNSKGLEVLNGSLIVREDSAITVNSRDNTPVTIQSSRDATPCLDINEPVSPIPTVDREEETEEIDSSFSEQVHVGAMSADSTFVESVPDTSLNIEIDLSPESTKLSEDSIHDENSEDEEFSSHVSPNSTTSLAEGGLVTQSTNSEDNNINQVNLGTSLVNILVDTCDIDVNDSLGRGKVKVDADDENIVHIKDSLNYSVNSDVSIDTASCNDIARSRDGSSDDDDNDGDYDDDKDVVERLKNKYIEMEKEDLETEEEDIISDIVPDLNTVCSNTDNDVHDDKVESGQISYEMSLNNEDIAENVIEGLEEGEVDQTDDNDSINHVDSDDNYRSFETNTVDTFNMQDDQHGQNINDDNANDNSDDDETDYIFDNDDGIKTKTDEYIDNDMDEEVTKKSVSENSSRRESLSPTMEQPVKAGEFDVTLTKPEGQGLGFTVAGGAKTTGGCYVKAVLQNPALSDGSIKPGDKLIMVNGVDMQPLNHFEAVSVLREAEEVVTIRLFREKVPEGDTRQAGVVNLSLSESLTPRNDDSNHQEIIHGKIQSDINNYINNKEESDNDESRSGVGADDTWPLQDLIASLQESLEESKQVKQSPVSARKNVENYWRDKSIKEAGSPKSPTTNVTEGSVYQIDIQKPKSGGLGISLVTAETQNQTGVFIRTITPGGVAEVDGRLEIGDKILQINGESLIGMNHNKAAAILRKYQGKLSLTVSRNKGKVPGLFESNRKDLRLMSNQDDYQNEETEAEDETCDNTNINDKHLVGNIVDEDVEHLVSEAERILKDANDELSEDSEIDTEKLGAMQEDHKKLVKHSHKYLSATEVIDFEPDEIRLDSDDDNDDDPFEDVSEGADKNNSCDTSIVEYDSSKSWCDNLRTLSIEVPEEVTREWLYDLSLVTIPEDRKRLIPDIIARLQEKIEIDDPQEEFKQLRNVPLTDECDIAMTSANRLKNRFRNVLPYDENRVRLSQGTDSDYINASHVRIELGTSICDYIVCQGPLPETSDAFWEMIWQEKVTVIVMLTLDVEAMKVKCHRYWPDSVDVPIDVCDGKLRVSLLYQNCLDDFDVRNILIENNESGETRCLYHLNYTTWPDHGTPTSALPLLQCLRLSHLYRSEGPIVVHCSAGIGRSGTFVTVDLVLAHIERGIEFDIFEIVKKLRRQRQGMIQTRIFWYDSVVFNH
ncbi:Protein tyrosine phosphatase [Mactra antiquata]